jgi:hypothetical protein
MFAATICVSGLPREDVKRQRLYRAPHIRAVCTDLLAECVNAIDLLIKKRHRMGGQNSKSRAPPCFERHVKPLIPATFAVVGTRSSFKERLTSGRRPIVKII